MKIVEKTFNHTCVGLPYECKKTIIGLTLDETDLPDAAMLEKFQYVMVERREYPNDKEDRETFVWLKGSHTKWFGYNTKDKKKMLVTKLVLDFIVDNQNQVLILEPFQDPREN
jgi:hypothetical protein